MPTRTHCPACLSADHRPAFCERGFSISRCAPCGSLFVTNLPTPEQWQSIYLQDTYYHHCPESADRIRWENARRVSTLQQLSEGRQLLDVGCAVGYFLDAARDAGYDALGVDQTPHTVAEAVARGHRVIQGTLEDLVRQRADGCGAYDVVAALDVIEHVPDPCAFLQGLVDMARPGGIVVLSTPNYSGLVARLMGRRDPFMIPPDHLNFFTFRGLHALADRVEAQVERTETFGRLTAPEMQRVGARFLPKPLSWGHQPVGSLVGLGIRMLNVVSLGIEAEVYLRKPAAAKQRTGLARAA